MEHLQGVLHLPSPILADFELLRAEPIDVSIGGVAGRVLLPRLNAHRVQRSRATMRNAKHISTAATTIRQFVLTNPPAVARR
jgi:hypothetical protein